MKILGYDFGLSLEHFVKLASEGNEVRLYTPWQTAFPKFENFAVGLGIEGIQKVLYFFDHVNWADLIVFFDLGAGDLVSYLRDKGYTVFGAGREGEELEQNRWHLKQIMKEIGLPLQNSVRIKGISELREYLKKNQNKYVKIDIFRGDIDSFSAKDYDSVKLEINKDEVALGPFSEEYQFVVEDYIEGTEPGFDLFFNGREFIKPYLWGIEFQKSAYLGHYVNELPKSLKLVAEKLTPYLQKIDYRGPMSSEVRLTKEGKSYLIDVCSRLPYPLSAVYTESIQNYTEVIYKTAKAQPVEIKVVSPYVAVLPLTSMRAEKEWVKLNFDPKLRDLVKIRCAAKVNDSYYAVKGMEVVYVLVATGDTIEEVKEKLEKTVEQVDALGLATDISLDPLYKEIEEAKRFGLDFT